MRQKKPKPKDRKRIPASNTKYAEIILDKVYFGLDSANLKPQSFFQLNQLVLLLRTYPNLNVLIMGHTDNQGGDDYNLDLSLRRAKAVANYLENHNIDPGRISHEGYGLTKPIAENTTPEGRQKNRRVSFKLIDPS